MEKTMQLDSAHHNHKYNYSYYNYDQNSTEQYSIGQSLNTSVPVQIAAKILQLQNIQVQLP